jgi:hypothetical protein
MRPVIATCRNHRHDERLDEFRIGQRRFGLRDLLLAVGFVLTVDLFQPAALVRGPDTVR